MGAAKKLAVIAAGYALSVAGGVAVVAVHELFLSDDVAQNSGGMAAFGDMILFVLAAGFLGLGPTWFLLKLAIEKAPRALLAAVLLIAALGPLSWLAVTNPTDDRVSNLPRAADQLLGLLIVFGAIPRIAAGPVLLVAEGVAFLLARTRVTRALLAAAMLMDLVPLSMFALHVARAILS
ncbi:MAG TPA: hypothetical protein VN802_14415 [Stellaceae bacterium]|nr:hypothetical protein [Stellaceae bacterium]